MLRFALFSAFYGKTGGFANGHILAACSAYTHFMRSTPRCFLVYLK